MDPLAARFGLFLGGLVAAVALGSLLYLLVSFAAMRRYTPVRSWRGALRSMAREAVAIAVTQPLILPFYFLGRRMGGARDGRPVIFVHGYSQNRVDFIYLAHAARRAKLGPLYGFNYNWTASVPRCARDLGAFVERVCRETGQPRVAIVAHSLGGVVALEYLATAEGAKRVERCVTIASPHAGVSWRGGLGGESARQLRAKSDYMRESSARSLAIPVLSIFSSHDNIVHPSSTSALVSRGGVDHSVDGIGHLSILFSREVAEVVVRLLQS